MGFVTPFGERSTADEVMAGVDLAGRRAVVTGGASGIGTETARALAGAGAEVTLAVRDATAGRGVARQIAADAGTGTVLVEQLDLTDLSSVREFARRWTGPLDILVNNAGVMATPLTRTSEGWELQFATNHLGHFVLTRALHGALGSSDHARVVSVSSSGHFFSPVVFEDIHFERRPYDPWSAYGQSKTANILFAVEANARWTADGIAVNALMPGSIRTNLQRHVPPANMEAMTAGTTWKTPAQGAATSVLLAASPLVEGVGGRYFENCNEAEIGTRGTGYVAPYALDPDAAARLWAVSSEMTGG